MKKRFPLIMSWLATLSLIISACVFGTSGLTARAQSHGRGSSRGAKRKISTDLSERLAQGTSTNGGAQSNLGVILQLEGEAGPQLKALLQREGVRVRGSFNRLGAQVVEVPAALVAELASYPEVSYVSADREMKPLGHVTATTGTDLVRSISTTTTTTSNTLLKSGSTTCTPIIGLSLLYTCTTTNSITLDGKGIGVAVLDSGVDASHYSLNKTSGGKDGSTTLKEQRVVFSKDFTGENRTDDPYGHGTYVATAIVGNKQLSDAYYSVAPSANIVNLRVLGAQGTGTVSSVLSALDWVLNNRSAYNIKVVNMSLGMPAIDSYRDDPVCRAVRKLVDAGVVVCVAAGNSGKLSDGQKVYGLIHSPGIEPSAITIGASNTFGTDARDDDTVTTFSSRGPTRSFSKDENGLKHYDNLVKPDLVAPGNKLIYAEAPGNQLVSQYPQLDAGVSKDGYADSRMMYLSGTSVSTPITAGAAALLLQANPSLTPNMVKMILMYTAQPLAGYNLFEQGAGQLNVEGAVRLALAVRTDLGASTPLGDPLLTTQKPPTPQTTIAGKTFPWAQGVALDHTFATGADIETKYQKVYGQGMLLSDGIVLSDGVVTSDSTMMTNGIILGNNIMTSNGGPLGDGQVFCSTGIILGNGIVLSDGIILTDGIVMSDGIMLSNGIVMSDGIILVSGIVMSDSIVLSSNAIKGDDTTCMH